MKRCHPSLLFIAGVLVLYGIGTGSARVAAQQDAPSATEGVEVLTRGPVHEAFAETVTFNPEPGIVAPKPEPAAIEELPPQQRPEGDNVAWIPGYWGWDDERNDFLWISGIWRDLPPDRQWVPGYWGQAGQGVQWTSGYWADAAVSEIDYLPEPPQSIENGPNVDAPSPDQSWLPGCWVWQQNRYAWRPGYWAAAQPDWVWVPAYYVWSPRGYVFVDGYWDHSVSRRGVLFAPVYFQANVFNRRGFSYSPATVINPAVFLSHLFLRPNYQHYYFGDYYAASYSQAGFYPGYSIHNSGHGYDPIYAHQSWQHRQDRDWSNRVAANFQRLRDDENARPPRTWSVQEQLSAGAASERGFVIAAPLEQLINVKDNPMRFQPINQNERQRLAQRAQEIQQFRQERQKLDSESARTSATAPVRGSEPTRVKLPASPLRGPSVDALGKDRGPLKTPQAPMPDLTIDPKPSGKLPAQPPPQSPSDVSRDKKQLPPGVAPRGNQPATSKPQTPLERAQSQPQPNLPGQSPAKPGLQPAVDKTAPNGKGPAAPQSRTTNRLPKDPNRSPGNLPGRGNPPRQQPGIDPAPPPSRPTAAQPQAQRKPIASQQPQQPGPQPRGQRNPTGAQPQSQRKPDAAQQQQQQRQQQQQPKQQPKPQPQAQANPAAAQQQAQQRAAQRQSKPQAPASANRSNPSPQAKQAAPAPKPAAPPAAGPKPEQSKDKGKGKGKG